MSDEAASAGPRVAVVYNPAKVDIVRLRAAVAEAETQNQRAPSLWIETDAADDGAQAAAEAADARPTAVLVAGGDGTVRAVAERLAGTGIPLAVAAAGTGNLLARALELPINDLPGAVDLAFTGTSRRLDMGHATLEHADGSVTSHDFLVMAGIGLDARMAAGTSPRLKKRLGWLAYADPIGRAVAENADFAVHYRLDGHRRRSIRAHTVIVGNCGMLTGGILLIPAARPDDGVLDTVMFRPRGAAGWMQIAIRLAFARFLHRTGPGRVVRRFVHPSYALRYGRARRIHVTFNAPQEVEIDGDSFGTITSATITTRPGVLRLITPGEGRAVTAAA